MERRYDSVFHKTISLLAPGTPLHEGLESILRAKTGALIVIGDSDQVMELVNGGFRIETEMNPAALYELAKMDGALVLNSDATRILLANTQLTPNSSIPTVETGTRHSTAERVARQTGEVVVSISQRRNVITVYRGNFRYVLRDVGVILAKANQALSTLEKYKSVFQRVIYNLNILEFEDIVTLSDVATCIQRSQMVNRVAQEIRDYIVELGTEGRLVNMQLEELMGGLEEEGEFLIEDYRTPEADPVPKLLETLDSWSSEELLDHNLIIRALGYMQHSPEQVITPRGYRLLEKIPRLPLSIIRNLVNTFHSFRNILAASIEELDEVEGIGEVRAKAIKEGLRRLRERTLLDRHI